MAAVNNKELADKQTAHPKPAKKPENGNTAQSDVGVLLFEYEGALNACRAKIGLEKR